MSPVLPKNGNAIAGMTKTASRPIGGAPPRSLDPPADAGRRCSRRPSTLATHSSTPIRGPSVVSTPSGIAGEVALVRELSGLRSADALQVCSVSLSVVRPKREAALGLRKVVWILFKAEVRLSRGVMAEARRPACLTA